MNRSLTELQYQCHELDLVFSAFDTKEMLMDLLATRLGKDDPTLQLPCLLSRDVKKIKEIQFQQLLTDPKYVYEQKIDGCRAKLHLAAAPGETRIDSRHRSVKTFQYREATENFPHMQALGSKDLGGTILDGECKMPVDRMRLGQTDTQDSLTSAASVFNSKPQRAQEIQRLYGLMQYIAFDILYYQGVDIRGFNFQTRREYLEKVIKQLDGITDGWLHLSTVYTTEPEQLFKDIVNLGGEGIMIKDTTSPYTLKAGSRPKAMYKWKKLLTGKCFVTGYVTGQGEFDGLVGSLLVSCYDKKNDQPREIGAVQPGDLAMRYEMSLADGSLAAEMYGTTLTCIFQQWTKNKRMRHAIVSNRNAQATREEMVVDFKQEIPKWLIS